MTNLDYVYDTGSHDLFRSTEEEDISTLRDETQSTYALFRSYLESFPSKRYIDSGPTPYGEET
jgi:hypothetical protein